MGNIGRPSTGCFLCRKRRVKCDEARPGCRNCTRLKKPCPGYREPNYGLIGSTHLVPPEADNRAERSLSSDALPQSIYLGGSSSSSDSDDVETLSTCSTPSALSRNPYRTPTPTLLSDDLTEQTICYSLNQLDISSRVLYGNHAFDFLPRILADSGRDSYLYAAMRSVGVVNFANRSRTVDMRGIIEQEYARAVSQVTAALADPELCLRDETLVAVWLLGIRELFAGVHAPQKQSAHQTHVDGALMLLRLRGEEQFSRPAGRHLFATILSAMHWKPLFASIEPSQEYLMLESQIPRATLNVPAASLRMRNFFHGVSKLRARVRNFLSLPGTSSVERLDVVESYLKAAARMEDKVKGWCDDSAWLPRKVHVKTTTRPSHRSPWSSDPAFNLHCFGSWDAFFHWNRFFVAKICLHAALLDAMTAVNKEQSDLPNMGPLSQLILVHTTKLQQTTRDFIGALAYAFGDVDGEGWQRPVATAFVSDGASRDQRGVDVPATLQVQPPLSYLITLKYLGPGQREAMYLALQRVRAEFCIL